MRIGHGEPHPILKRIMKKRILGIVLFSGGVKNRTRELFVLSGSLSFLDDLLSDVFGSRFIVVKYE